MDIVEDYTQKCSISTLRVDERNKKLIIESQRSSHTIDPLENETQEGESELVDIKKEPELLLDEQTGTTYNKKHARNDLIAIDRGSETGFSLKTKRQKRQANNGKILNLIKAIHY